ncbi:MAG: GAF domain-containing protein [Steroidobacteraceae bacterium]
MAPRVLIVDDDPAGRELLVTLMRFKGHEPLEAADGAQALEIVRQFHPELVISDILMPTMDGYEFVQRLRNDASLEATAVIFYTASYHEKEAMQLASTGRVARVLVKPCEPATLLQVIAEVMSGKGMPVASGVPKEFDTEQLKLLTDKLWQRTSELEAVNARFGALTDLHVQLASERNPRMLLEQVCNGARKLFGARYAVLAARDRSADGQSFFAISGLDFKQAQPQRPVIDSGALGRVYASGQPWRISRTDGASIDAGLPAGFPRAQAFLAVPLVSLTQSYGWICLAEKIGAESFSDDDERLFTLLGAQVGRIYENGSLYGELQRRSRHLQDEIAERERATAGLRASEERFRQLAENIQDVFFVASSDLKELHYLSPAYSQIWGQSGPQSTSCADILMESIEPADRQRVAAAFEAIASGDSAFEIEYRIRRREGSTSWVRLRTFPVLDPDAAGKRTVGIASDVTESRQAAARIEHLNRVYAVLSNINTLIVRVRQRDELFRESCRLAVQFGRFAVAWIGWLDPKSGAIEPAAWAASANDLAIAVKPALGPDPAEDGIAAAALRTREPQICNDILADDRPIAFREEMVRRGFRGIVGLPLIVGDVAAGCLVLVTEEADFFNEEELRLLVELAGDISFALDHIEKSEQPF